MKRVILILLLALSSVSVLAQKPRVTATWLNAEETFVSQRPASPFRFLTKAAQTLGPGSICHTYYYYNPTSFITTLTQPLPSSRFAVRVTPTSVCTVMSINLDFDIINPNLQEKDTVYVFMKEAVPPYTLIMEGYYLARVGPNQMQFSVFPVPQNTPPAFGNSVLNPFREFYFGAWIKGSSAHSVVWKFLTPQMYGGSNPRSVMFTTPSSWVSASSVVGQPVDWLASATICVTPPVTPVELSSLNAILEGRDIHLRWETTSELNNYGFMVERSTEEEGPFTPLTFVEGRGTTHEPQSYSFMDREVTAMDAPVLWYRLQQIDLDGTRSIFGPVRVQYRSPATLVPTLFAAYPHPFAPSRHESLTLRYQLPESAQVSLQIHDLLGRTLATVEEGYRTAGNHSVQWTPTRAGIPTSGMYFLRLQAGEHMVQQRFMVER